MCCLFIQFNSREKKIQSRTTMNISHWRIFPRNSTIYGHFPLDWTLDLFSGESIESSSIESVRKADELFLKSPFDVSALQGGTSPYLASCPSVCVSLVAGAVVSHNRTRTPSEEPCTAVMKGRLALALLAPLQTGRHHQSTTQQNH